MSVAMQRLETGTRQADSRREAARLAALAAYDVLDTPPERHYDDLTRLAAEYFQADAACLGFADERRVWIKSCWGQHVRELPRANSVFDLVLEEGGLVVVSDVNCRCACGKPLLVRILDAAFFASAPVRTPDGKIVAALTVFSGKPRPDGRSAPHARKHGRPGHCTS